ncbi:MAG: FG-GAP-like repeat-containing protein, partial [Candidatus Moranbacteria bacterium]|nr:FG-GAP-like repeat-containing protein [Candidatus Moranbacteria bacterium]
MNFSKKQLFSFGAPLCLAALFGFAIFFFASRPSETLQSQLGKYGVAGERIVADLGKISQLTPVKTESGFEIIDDMSTGIDIQFANQNGGDKSDEKTKIVFPENLSKPLTINLPGGKSISVTDKNSNGSASVISQSSGNEVQTRQSNDFFSPGKNIPTPEQLKNFVEYKSSDGRKNSYYGYQKDAATGEKKLKNWILYAKGNGKESESYAFDNARIVLDESGNAKVFFDDGKAAQNQQVMADVDQSLLARAQKAIMADAGTDILAKDQNQIPDFVVPHPYYVDSQGQLVDLKWNVDGTNKSIYVDFEVKAEQYPIALDPTLAFSVPAQSNTSTVMSGIASGDQFGSSMISGDFNGDGKTDLAVGASGYGFNAGRVYIFYNDGSISNSPDNADVIITGDASGKFGSSLVAGDFNADGKTDLAVGSNAYGSNAGGAYIFYNDGNFPTTSLAADVIIAGEAGSYFGTSLAAGDFNADSKTDLAVGAYIYNTNQGRAYIFYADGSFPTTAATADVIITGETDTYFGTSMTAGDFNADGKTDLAVGAMIYSSNAGRAYVFYNDGSIPTTAATADVTITGEAASYFGTSMTVGDFNADGKTDLAVGGYNYNSAVGRAYVFYNDGSIPTTAATADVIITGESGSFFGVSMTNGDFNADGKIDLAVGAHVAGSNSNGRAYIFYNDGSMPTTAATADVIITGESGSQFGLTMSAGDFNNDEKTDIIIGTYYHSGYTGRAYIFYSQNGQVNLNKNITGEASGDYFGNSMSSGDFNADGKTDLVVGAPSYNSSQGRIYIFYNKGFAPTAAASADVVITGEAGSKFGYFSAAGDFNADSKTDLAVGAVFNSSSQGRTYVFYNDGSIPTVATSADVVITGEAVNNSYFGNSMTAGDFNGDGKTDLAVGAYGISSSAGRVYVFNGGSMSATIAASAANMIISGEASSNFGTSMAAGDFNADGKIDLAIGAYTHSSSTGRAYIFYNDGTIPTTAATADVIISGEYPSYFGFSMTAGDFNADGKTDLAVAAISYSGNNGRAYVFNGGSMSATIAASAANVIITGEGYFGFSMTAGDFNGDGKTDLAIGGILAASIFGRAYVFYNDGNYPTTAVTADVVITGEAASNNFGSAIVAGDFNADGKTDLAVGAYGYNSNQGRAYIYETRDSYAWILQKNQSSPRILGNVGQEVSITGETGSDFGFSMTSGDFNNDGKTDLIVGAYNYSTTGRVYVFYDDGSVPITAVTADVVITGEAASSFGYALIAGDFNADGKTDFVVSTISYSTNTGRAYVFYNDGSIPTTAATADVTITGEAASNFGYSMTSGDFNSDGETDLAVGAIAYSSSAGRAYIFYGDGSIPTTAATADLIITGETASYFGTSMTSGDFNADGKIDLAVGAMIYSSNAGRVYIFYNDGSIPTTAATADVIITGETASYFGTSMIAGDFNADGKIDLAVGAQNYSSNAGRTYVFYGDGSIPTTAATADVVITGESSSQFGRTMTSGDFNDDGKADLAVGASGYNSDQGRAYVFYNDGSIPTTATSADAIITGESASNNFGTSLLGGDFNNDGKTDLAVGASGYSLAGKIYIYTNNETKVAGEDASNLGTSMTSGDFNADGKTDLAVGASGYNSNQGRAYIFYGGTFSSSVSAAGANVVITGEAVSNFGISMIADDFNDDGKTDLAVGADAYSANVGRVYIFNGDSMSANMTAASNANVTFIGEWASHFGSSLTSGDFNADGKTDLVIGAYFSVSASGRAYIFNGGSMTPTIDATSANVIITGEANSLFGYSLSGGDFNSDGKTDLAVGAYVYSSSAGRVYVFYNGTLTSSVAAGSADVMIIGESASNYFGWAMTAGDFNGDGKTDLAVGAWGYSSNTGRTYVFYNDGTIPTTAATADVVFTGESANSNFGYQMMAGDLNADGKTDLVVSATGYASSAGKIYVYYNNNGLRKSFSGNVSMDSPASGAG